MVWIFWILVHPCVINQIQVCLGIIAKCPKFCSGSMMQIHWPVVQVVCLVVGFPFYCWLICLQVWRGLWCFCCFHELHGWYIAFCDTLAVCCRYFFLYCRLAAVLLSVLKLCPLSDFNSFSLISYVFVVVCFFVLYPWFLFLWGGLFVQHVLQFFGELIICMT